MSSTGNSMAAIGNFDQPVLPIVDPKSFSVVRNAIEAAFAEANLDTFLAALDRARLRIRDFESVLAKGKLGAATVAEYSRLGNNDQGQIREFYLGRLEQIPAALRDRFFRLYAYY